ncbi:hypothetical protein [Paraburkholderia sp. UCT70]|uniref:hypothetical protein n=1 Tax=Paraburkholderia sp. UCT70 TaxID=2991068 RepID=UPI003D1AA7FF
MSVDVDFRHIVHDYGHPLAFAVIQDVVQERGLARAEKAGQYGDGELVHGKSGASYVVKKIA